MRKTGETSVGNAGKDNSSTDSPMDQIGYPCRLPRSFNTTGIQSMPSIYTSRV